MADQTRDSIASTGAFRAFSSDGSDDATEEIMTGRRPSPLVYVTAIVLLAALVLGVLVAIL